MSFRRTYASVGAQQERKRARTDEMTRASPPACALVRLVARALEGDGDGVSVAKKLLDHVDTAGQRAVIAGTDIKVSQIATEHEHLGMTPDEIVEAHPHLTLADVHAALTYFYDHPDEIRRDWDDADALVTALRERYRRRERPSR